MAGMSGLGVEDGCTGGPSPRETTIRIAIAITIASMLAKSHQFHLVVTSVMYNLLWYGMV